MEMNATAEEDTPTTLHIDRLILRLADPSNTGDSQRIPLDLYRRESQKHHRRAGETQTLRSQSGILHPHATSERAFLSHFFCELPRQAEAEGEGDFIGVVGISFRPDMPYPDLGWILLEPYQGYGYATEAAGEALRFWRDVVGVKEICAMTPEDNLKSQRCAERVGFVRAGSVDVVVVGGGGEGAVVEGKGDGVAGYGVEGGVGSEDLRV